MRAYVFRFAPESGRRATWSACPFRAKSRHHSITFVSAAEERDWDGEAEGFGSFQVKD